LKKDISRGIINIRALANYITNKYSLDVSLDSIISAIRRHNISSEKQRDIGEVYSILKQAKMKTLTKMASISLKKDEEATETLGNLLPKVDYQGGETLRVLEGAKLFKLIVDQKSFEKVKNSFNKRSIIETNKKIGMIEMVYPDILQKIPGVFSALSTELGEHDISIIDALICSNEHIIVVDEKDMLKAFEILYNMCN
jgi:aspartokinase